LTSTADELVCRSMAASITKAAAESRINAIKIKLS
jgi:hypothetical protein